MPITASQRLKLVQFIPWLNEQQLDTFETILPLYEDWNQKVNLISRKDIEHLVERHLLHCLCIAKYCQFTPGTTLLDLGTGGGFPALPLAIAFPEVTIHAVDSIRKKIHVVEDIVAKAKINNVHSHWMRAENFPEKVDFVVTRAVASTDKLMAWTKGKFKKDQKNSIRNGIIALKGGDLESEIMNLKGNYHIQNLYDYLPEEFYSEKKILYISM